MSAGAGRVAIGRTGSRGGTAPRRRTSYHLAVSGGAADRLDLSPLPKSAIGCSPVAAKVSGAGPGMGRQGGFSLKSVD
jgi:hypothetical protein